MSKTLALPQRLDYQSLPDLLDELKSVTDDSLVLDAQELRHLGTLPLQTIMSAIKTRAEAGKSTRIANANDACIEMLGLFGFSPETLSQPEAWT
ncbi:STAS domain-containing protein [Celeribacter sp.]|uniref:STAS domain-containing protein n=1 Tax=Celeribacter sp. TaxID=1890673 RepID=UPI003A915C29